MTTNTSVLSTVAAKYLAYLESTDFTGVNGAIAQQQRYQHLQHIVSKYPLGKNFKRFVRLGLNPANRKTECKEYRATKEFEALATQWRNCFLFTCQECGGPCVAQASLLSPVRKRFCSPACSNGSANTKRLKKLTEERTGSRPARNEKAKEVLRRKFSNRAYKARVIEAKRATSQARIGADHHMQTDEGFRRSQEAVLQFKSFSYKDYTFRKVQGYEPQALKHIIDRNPHALIATGFSIRSFHYEFEGRTRRYFPDLWVNGAIVEVKSTWTWEKDKAKTCAKMRSVAAQGFIAVLMVMAGTGELLLSRTWHPKERGRTSP